MNVEPLVRVLEDSAALAEAAAEEVVGVLGAAVAARGKVSLVLAGGSTPRELYRRLAGSPWRERVDWGAVELYWGDERCVAADDPASNYRMASETLLAGLEAVGVEPAAVHRIAGELGAEEAVRDYDRTVREMAGDPPRFDLVLLGMGEDGHTASLFPATVDPEGSGRLAIATVAPVAPHERVSLTLGALNGAETVVFLVAGADKAEAVARALGQVSGDPADAPPAARVRPRGRLLWLLDREAARLLRATIDVAPPMAAEAPR